MVDVFNTKTKKIEASGEIRKELKTYFTIHTSNIKFQTKHYFYTKRLFK